MQSLSEKERAAKLQAIENCLWGVKLLTEADTKAMAILILAEIEQVEVEMEDRWFQAKEANAD